MANVLAFDRTAREAIELAYNNQWRAKNAAVAGIGIDHPEIVFNRNGFIRTLEIYAEALRDLEGSPMPQQRDRKRNLEKLATALNNLSAQLAETDSEALAYTISLAAPKVLGESEAQRLGILDYWQASVRASADVGPIVGALYQAARQASKDLPPPKYRARSEVAISLLRLIAGHGFAFSVTSTGFAGQCWIAINHAAGLESDSAQYWLEEAKKAFPSGF